MKNLFIVLSFVISFSQCTSKKSNDYQAHIKLFQYQLNTQYANSETSPLTQEDLKDFKSLAFFKIDETYKVTAVLERTPNTHIFKMQTTTKRLPLYRKYAEAHFTLHGKKLSLSIYQNQKLMETAEYKYHLFLPFNDATNGSSSYGGGRFIDLEIPEEGAKTIEIDFNKAYNPYCTYNPKYSCPIPPAGNNLNIAIPVGVKAYSKKY